MRRALLSTILCILLSGCGSGGKIAAVVNGHLITVGEVDRRMAQMQVVMRPSEKMDRKRVLEQMVMERVLLQEVGRRRLERDPEVLQRVGDAHQQILLVRLMEILGRESSPQISEQEIRQFYDGNPDRFIQPETFRASHILVSDEETAKKALSRVKGGEPFAQVAAELSTDPTKSRGGDIGSFSGNQVIPEFSDACRKLKPGQVSDVVKTPLGYHVILLTESKLAGRQPLEEVQDQIRRMLEQQQRQRYVETAVQGLRAKSHVRIREEILGSSAPPASSVNPPAAAAPSQGPNS